MNDLPSSKYRALRFIASVFKFIGASIIVIPIVLVLLAVIGDAIGTSCAASNYRGSFGLGNLVLGIIVGIPLLCLLALPFYASGELIMVFIDTEESARNTCVNIAVIEKRLSNLEQSAKLAIQQR